MKTQFYNQIKQNSSIKNFNLAKEWLCDMKENIHGQSSKQTSLFRARINEIVQLLELEENRREIYNTRRKDEKDI